MENKKQNKKKRNRLSTVSFLFEGFEEGPFEKGLNDGNRSAALPFRILIIPHKNYKSMNEILTLI